MNRRKSELQALDLASWPEVAYTELDTVQQRAFERRRQALVRYAEGDSLRQIEKATGVNRRELYRWLERAMAPHSDGRPYGFRALGRYMRIAEYARVSSVNFGGERGNSGGAGALSQLFERYPPLSDWLRLQVKRRRRGLLEQVNTDGRLQTRLRGLQAIHDEFLRQCRAVGLKATDYPFNTAGRAIRSLSGFLKSEMLRSFGLAARAAGATHLKGLPHREAGEGSPAATRPYQIVEFDGHRLDLRLKVVARDPLGFEHEFEIERVWLLAIIDVCTRAVLGYNLVLAREYCRYDVIKTIEKALEPHPARAFSLDGLGYEPECGLPSQRWPELSYVTWEWMKLDNAKANLTSETLRAMCEFTGCIVDAGPRYSPDERPYIERFFGTMAQRLSSRLPGYTGSHPRDLRRALADPKGDLRLYVSLDELEELVEYAITTYNGTPHTGLNNVTPLEAIEYHVSTRQTVLTRLTEQHRRTLCLMQAARRCRVRAYLEQGVRPHINLYGVRYTSGVLARSTRLVGKEILVYLNADDLRCVRAFLPDGSELGVLDAQGAWGVVPHNLKLRQEIRKLRDRRRGHQDESNPIEAYLEAKLAQAKTSRKAATEYARTVRTLASAPTTRTPAKAPPTMRQACASTAAAPGAAAPHSVPIAPQPPAQPRKLTIGTGQVF
ncbi:transposase family protein [Cupriavidus laharis]|nr:transposase family protein [Cupriavidus laharis]